MKKQIYYNNYCGREACETTGYTISLPVLDGIEFAVVRPSNWGCSASIKGWQVIHVCSGCRIAYRDHSEPTIAEAIASAKAMLASRAKVKGWAAIVRKIKRSKTPHIIAALEKQRAA